MKILIKNGNVIDPKTGFNGIANIYIKNGKIFAITSKSGIRGDITSDTVIDASGKYVFPGFIDAHCHLRDPGYEYKEDIESGTASAAMGGFTSIACMPNTDPVADNKAVISYIRNKAAQEGYVNVYPIGAITKGSQGKELAEIGELKFAGAVGISDDGKPVDDPSLMKKAMVYAAMFEMPVISHCEDLRMADGGVMNEGVMSSMLGLKGIPSPAEEIMVARDLILSEYTGTPVHIAHVSTALSVELIRNAKKRQVKVTAETCPHYFTLTEDACDGYSTLAKMNPPLRTEKDVKAVISGLADGTIDVIATDHAPHHNDEKELEFDLASNGIVGFETAFPLAYTYLVQPGYLKLDELISKIALNPSKILSLNKGTLEEGGTADIVIADLANEFVVDVSTFKSKSRNSPYNGYKLKGSISDTIVNGKIIVREGVLL